jgi:two-component system, OmpR family, phosphate regulon sensor histidine kinase PhoR
MNLLLQSQYLRKIILASPFLLFVGVLVYLETLSLLNAFILSVLYIFSIVLIFWSYSKDVNNSSSNIEDTTSLFDNIMENLTDPLLLLDNHQKIILMNKSAKNMFNKNDSHQQISDLIPDFEVLKAIEKALETGKSDTVEFKLGAPIVKDLLLRIHILEQNDSSSNTILGDNIEGRRIFLTIYNITSIKKAERMRVDFVANVSHELRTPLASILGFVETLQGPAKNDLSSHEQFLKIMADEAKRMKRLIEDLLSLSHIERDAHIPPENNVSLVKVINNVVETLKIQLSDKNMTLTFHADHNNGDIYGDRDQLIQVFQNLIDNAIKYGQENTNISVSLRDYNHTQDDKHYYEISIINLGSGIAPQHIERLTERFYRVDTARSRSLGGTGLGLAIVKHILQRHHGMINFSSELGISTTVTILLPTKM